MITKIIDLKELERIEKEGKEKELKGDSKKGMIQDEDITKLDLVYDKH